MTSPKYTAQLPLVLQSVACDSRETAYRLEHLQIPVYHAPSESPLLSPRPAVLESHGPVEFARPSHHIGFNMAEAKYMILLGKHLVSKSDNSQSLVTPGHLSCWTVSAGSSIPGKMSRHQLSPTPYSDVGMKNPWRSGA